MEGATKVVRLVRARLVRSPRRLRRRILRHRRNLVLPPPLQRRSPADSACSECESVARERHVCNTVGRSVEFYLLLI